MTLAVRVPASTSNLGAGFDCLGLALDLWLEATLAPGAGPPVYSGALTSLTPETDAVHRHLSAAGVAGGHRLQVHSDIPVGRGLGSSAAARVAAIALEHLARGLPAASDDVYRVAVELEGHPDNAAPAVYGGLVLAAGTPTPLSIHERVAVALAVPQRPVHTEAARRLLPETVPRRMVVEQAARVAALVQGLAAGDGPLIAYGMEDRLAVPHRKALIPGFDGAVEAGGDAGAYGVTISGSGSALVALAAPEAVAEVAKAMVEALECHGNPATAVTPAISHQGFTTT